MLIDTHCHPFSDEFSASEQSEYFSLSAENGVNGFVIVSYDKNSLVKAQKMAKQADGTNSAIQAYYSLGIHPNKAEELTAETAEYIEKTAKSDYKCVAIGESGLDFFHMKNSKESQEQAFRKQIQLAKKLDLPCIVHSRDAKDDTFRILQEEDAQKVIFHCYSYDLEFAKKVWNKGYFTSFSGIITYKNVKNVQESALHAPKDLMLIETDSPWLAPQSQRSKRNHSAYLKEVATFLSELRGQTLDALSIQLKANTQNAFSRMQG